ncbi:MULTISPECIES: L-fuculose-phosphate aldolase [Oceanotoga]|uniref:L-fuculose 1-phosphate aldolase n=1 Tax=Oceanotoga teriensis TaxID=515440 RepID=A0AA45HHB7_9BACT|nr:MULTISPECIES: L-fuculose-phosphate aldolase [Oceanotoga]MDN5342752.1 L-fuculose-phosphate aldolase [Oceanotoga sp.]MDO7975776.1 L-fuculose-phosphate aldolase [Oceanotoga teriensis]PWJ85150.1 L-fuculose 1-phosphate aldolase [Oceanotoga teriensis]
MNIKIREKIVKYSQKMIKDNLTKGTGGNISVFDRNKSKIYITPSGLDYMEMKEEDIVVMNLNGKKLEGNLNPSSEFSMHKIFYENDKKINAVVHTHSIYATTMACLNKEIPAIHYLIGFAGKKIPVVPYYTYGTKELAENAYKTLKESSVCLLANHGLLAVGENLMKTYEKALMVEFVAEIYYRTLLTGKPNILSNNEMEKILKKFDNYGQKNN